MIHAFKQIRLSNYSVLVTGAGTMMVGAESVVYQSQTGVFANQTYVNNVSGELSTRLNETGSYLLSQIAASSAGVSQLNGLSGSLTASGYGNITVTTSGQVIRISGDTGAYANFATTTNLFNTGVTLNTKIDNLSGYANSTFALSSQATGYVRMLSIQAFVTGIPTGIDNYFVGFPSGNFPTVPKIQATVEVTGDIMYMVNVRNRTISGYTAIFSDTIQESGVSLHTFATIN